MATVYGVNKTKYNNAIGENLVSSGVNKGQVCSMYDTYEASALAAASVIEVCDKLPKGAVVTDIIVATDDLGTGVTIDVGDATTVDRYGDGIDVASAAVQHTYPLIAEIANIGYVVTGSSDDQIQITVGGSAATGTVKVLVKYTV